MYKNQFPLLSSIEQTALHDVLHYMKMAELKRACLFFALPDAGKKTQRIERILMFIQTGKVTKQPHIPAQSLAKNHPPQPLDAASLMLKGGYKNDAQTRAFFKQLIGSHFHFTAFGIDWLNERWQKGNPPTYQEFADYWVAETERRAQQKQKPKDEWMFIRFMQQMKTSKPNASKDDLMEAWKALQAQKAQEARRLLQKAATKLATKS